jgi:hypothetical protein
MTPCPICGKANGACGHQPLAFPPIDLTFKGAKMADRKIYVPKQRTNRGVAGYRGTNVVIVDDKTFEQKAAPAKVVKAKAKK